MENNNKMKPFDPRRYPVVTRVVDGYLEVSQPDLGIYRYKKRFDDVKTAEEIGMMVLEVMNEAIKEYSKIYSQGNNPPSPSQPKGVLQNQAEPSLSITEVARILGVSQDTIRRMCADGKLTPTLTRGGHRRFSRAQLEDIRT